MQFNSIPFIFTFLPIFLLVYYLCPWKLKNAALLLASVLFYGLCVAWKPLPLIALFMITAVTYCAGLLLEKPGRKVFFWAVMILLAGILVFFKCYAGGRFLPAGMSFYLFQITAYLVCVYQGKMRPEGNLVRYGLSVMMFPKILSGPMADPVSLQKQITKRQSSLKGLHNGLQLLIIGLAMKVALANRLGALWSQADVVGYAHISPIFAWLALCAYVMKLYFDFFGYSLMAVGLGRMLGFQLPHNFIDPYCAKSVSEFYRRWHITLGAWFRENIYIPLGGNRKGLARTILNLVIVWALTGFWHGVGGNYMLWAAILVFFIILERLFLGKLLNKSKVLCHFYVVPLIFLSWVPFAIGDFEQMCIFFGRLFSLGPAMFAAEDYPIWIEKYGLMLSLGAFLMTPIPRFLWKKLEKTWVADVLCFILFWVAVYFIATAAQDPFMYGQY